MTEKTKEIPVKSGEIQEVKPKLSMTPYEEMDRLFDEFLSRNWLSPFSYEWPSKRLLLRRSLETKMPQVDVIDRDKEIVIRCEIPGVDKKDLEVSMTDNSVTIKGSTRHEEKEEAGDYYRREISCGTFSRTLSLPCDVDSEKIQSSFKNGVLELIAPKAKAVKRHKIKL